MVKSHLRQLSWNKHEKSNENQRLDFTQNSIRKCKASRALTNRVAGLPEEAQRKFKIDF